MLMPSMLRRNVFDDLFEYPFSDFSSNSSSLMKTDIKETADGYELSVDLPGVNKEDIKAELNNGYLNISAVSNRSNDRKDSEGNYIRRERFSGSYSRSFYVGDSITQDEIKAKFDNGVLILDIPKKQKKTEVEEKKYIAIEG